MGAERREGFPLGDANLPLDADELLDRVLLHEAHRADQVDERRRAAVHDRHFLGIELDDQVVHAKAPERRQQMLHGRNLHAAIGNAGGQRCVGDVLRASANAASPRQVGADKVDACILPGRA